MLFRSTDNAKLVCYTDADWASSHDRKSTSGFLIYYGNNLVSWSSKKQTTVALSSTEAEIVAATEAVRELIWIRQLIVSFGIVVDTPTLYCDSQPAIYIAHATGFNARSKHLDVKYKFLAQCVYNDDVNITYVSTNDMYADLSLIHI